MATTAMLWVKTLAPIFISEPHLLHQKLEVAPISEHCYVDETRFVETLSTGAMGAPDGYSEHTVPP